MNKQEIKKLRRKHNLDTRQLAEICGVSHRTVEGWEQGRSISKPALRHLWRLK